jgi:hypothetical protein
MALRELDDLGQGSDIAVHREHAVGHDQSAPVLGLGESPGQMLDVAMVVDEYLGA